MYATLTVYKYDQKREEYNVDFCNSNNFVVSNIFIASLLRLGKVY